MYASIVTVMPVSFLNSFAAARRAPTWDCLNVHISSESESLPESDDPPQAERVVSVSAVVAARATSRTFRANGMRMAPT